MDEQTEINIDVSIFLGYNLQEGFGIDTYRLKVLFLAKDSITTPENKTRI